MKEVIYRVEGSLTEDMIPSLQMTLEAVVGVRAARLDSRNKTVSLTVDDGLTEEETALALTELSSVLRMKGLSLGSRMATDQNPTDGSDAPSTPDRKDETNPSLDSGKLQSQHMPPSEGKTRPVVPVSPEPTNRTDREKRKVTVTAAVVSVLTAVVLTVLLTFSLTVAYYRADEPDVVKPGSGSVEKGPFGELEIIDRLFRSATVHEMTDEKTLIDGVLKGYIQATGDRYAEYLNAEEYKASTEERDGKMCGIGIRVLTSEADVNGTQQKVIMVVDVYADSPAFTSGVRSGDLIVAIGLGDNAESVQKLGYTEALNRMRGEEGTKCEFVVFRKDDTGSDGTMEFSVERKILTTRSVTFRRMEQDPTVGLIRVIQFDNTTPLQFAEAVDDLKKSGCDRFVFDLRNNPGGLLTSVEDVLTYFLKENDLILSTKNRAGEETKYILTVSKDGKVMSGSGTLLREDVGKYRDLKFSVLVNEMTASAAELFTSNIRDYKLGTVVGVKTYGKGSMQTTFPLSRYGYDGGLKLTTNFYFPPCGEGYDGIGITPDIVEELSDEAKKQNLNILPEKLDNQLLKAVESIAP